MPKRTGLVTRGPDLAQKIQSQFQFSFCLASQPCAHNFFFFKILYKLSPQSIESEVFDELKKNDARYKQGILGALIIICSSWN